MSLVKTRIAVDAKVLWGQIGVYDDEAAALAEAAARFGLDPASLEPLDDPPSDPGAGPGDEDPSHGRPA